MTRPGCNAYEPDKEMVVCLSAEGLGQGLVASGCTHRRRVLAHEIKIERNIRRVTRDSHQQQVIHRRSWMRPKHPATDRVSAW
jgi:hypothetical protein